MANKFKIGDKIIRIDMRGTPYPLKMGDIVTVSRATESGNLAFEEYPKKGIAWNERYFELYEGALSSTEVLIFN